MNNKEIEMNNTEQPEIKWPDTEIMDLYKQMRDIFELLRLRKWYAEVETD